MSVQSLTTEGTELVKTPTSIKAPVLWSKWFEEAKDSLSTNFEHHVLMNPWATSVETNQVKITFMLLEWIFYMTTLCYKKMISYSRNSSPSRPDLQVHKCRKGRLQMGRTPHTVASCALIYSLKWHRRRDPDVWTFLVVIYSPKSTKG